MSDLDSRTKALLQVALEEDLGDAGDITSSAIFGSDEICQAVIAAKEAGVLSGVSLVEPLFRLVDERVTCTAELQDAAQVKPSDVIARLEGPVRGILAGERTILNLLQRLSGIATLTSRMVERIGSNPARLLDTRKTTPTMRALEKQAVVHGGGCNHRFGLFDMVLIKDTHVKAAGGVDAAIRRAREHLGTDSPIKVEAEVQSIDEFHAAASAGPDRIMLDNMSPEDMQACVAFVRRRELPIELEASGNVSLETIGDIAATGVDFVSVGSVTHSAPALDIHLVLT